MSKQFIMGIIDDDDIYRYTIQRTIRDLNISKKNLIFKSGREALQYLSENMDIVSELPDILLLDVNMPLMDGFEFMKHYELFVHKLPKKIIIYMISSSINPEDINRAKNLPGITDYLVKPIKAGKLEAVLSTLE